MLNTKKVNQDKSTGKPETNPKHCIINDTKGNPVVVKSYREAVALANKNHDASQKDKNSLDQLIGIRDDQDRRDYIIFSMLYELHEKNNKTIEGEYMRTLYSIDFFNSFHPFAPKNTKLISRDLNSVNIQVELVGQN